MLFAAGPVPVVAEALGHTELVLVPLVAVEVVEDVVLAPGEQVLAVLDVGQQGEELEGSAEQMHHSVASYPSSVLVVYRPLLVLVYCSVPPCIPLLKSIIPPYPAYGIPHLPFEVSRGEEMLKVINPVMLIAMITKAQSVKYLSLSLRAGLAFTFTYAGIDAIREPSVWAAFLPPIAFKYAPMKLVLDGFSISQLVLAVALLWKKSSFYAATASTATLIGIVASSLIMDPNSMLIVFRDFGLIFASAALMLAELPKYLRRKS